MSLSRITAAVLSVLAGTAAAQSSVSIYGTLIPDFQVASSSGADASIAPAGAVATAGGATAAVAGGSSVRGIGGAAAAGSSPQSGAYTATPANQGSRTRMNPGASNIGFRGTENISDGLAAWFQIELTVTLGTPFGNPDGINHGNAPFYRNTAVGLRSSTWGSISVGAWDTPFNVLGASTSQINGITSGPSTGVLANLLGATTVGYNIWSAQNENAACMVSTGVGGATCVGAGTNFDRRQKGLLQWWSPNWKGIEARVAYAATQFSDGSTASSRAAGSLKPSIWDMSLTFGSGPLSIGYAYSRQNSLFAYAASTAATAGTGIGTLGAGVAQGSWQITGAGAGAVSGSTGIGHRLGGKYKFDLSGGNSISVGTLWESLKWSLDYAGTTAGDLTELKKTAWRVQGNYVTGRHLFGIEYARANELSGSITSTVAAPRAFNGSGTGARAYVLSYAYTLSKRSTLFAYYTGVTNDTNSNYSGITLGGIATAAGADPRYYGLSFRHTF